MIFDNFNTILENLSDISNSLTYFQKINFLALFEDLFK